MYSIYTLIDPRDDHVCYVGITEDVYVRFAQHLRCTDNNIDKNSWIQELKSANVMLIMRTIELAETFEEAREREDYWIHFYLSQGERLLNAQIAQLFTYEDFVSKFNTIIRNPTETSHKKSERTAQRDAKIRQFAANHPEFTHAKLATKFKVSVSTIARALSPQTRNTDELVAIEKPSTNGHHKERDTEELAQVSLTEEEVVFSQN